ncbi:MAG: hypothetical protein WAO47_02330 [Caldicoprobacterales bacterium]
MNIKEKQVLELINIKKQYPQKKSVKIFISAKAWLEEFWLKRLCQSLRQLGYR